MGCYKRAKNLSAKKNQQAMIVANNTIAPKTRGRTLRPLPNSEDAQLREEWMNAYITAGGEYEEVYPAGKKPSGVKQPCPKCPTKVEFHGNGSECGWEPSSNIPWKAVQQGKNDTVKAVITPADNVTFVKFESLDNKATVSPAQASSASQILTITGISSGEGIEIKATCDGNTLGAFKVNVYSFSLPITIAESARRPGLNADGTIANDMRYGDYSAEQIRNIRSMFGINEFVSGYSLDTVSANLLFAKFREMATILFATGDLQENINAMIDKFESNSGGEYSNPILTQAVREHDSTKRFEQQIRSNLSAGLNRYKGDINKLIRNRDIVLIGNPRFNTTGDIIRGLTIAINDVWAYEVRVIEYDLSDRCYRGKFNVILYDHFGLDEPDIDDVDHGRLYGMLAGFRAWFILQHLDRLSYRPFVTKIDLEYSFEGRLN